MKHIKRNLTVFGVILLLLLSCYIVGRSALQKKAQNSAVKLMISYLPDSYFGDVDLAELATRGEKEGRFVLLNLGMRIENGMLIDEHQRKIKVRLNRGSNDIVIVREK